MVILLIISVALLQECLLCNDLFNKDEDTGSNNSVCNNDNSSSQKYKDYNKLHLVSVLVCILKDFSFNCYYSVTRI